MSSKKQGNRVRDIPLKKDGSVDFSKLPVDENGQTEIDRAAEEAYQNGTLKAVDILGNEETIEPIMDMMFTGKEYPVSIYNIMSIIKHFQGEILTIVDATFVDERRLKYVKDIVKRSFTDLSGRLYTLSLHKDH